MRRTQEPHNTIKPWRRSCARCNCAATTNDAHNTALTQHSMGMVFLNQGRFGAAVSNLNDSVQGFRAAKDHSRIMAQVLIDYADALARAGRSGEVGKTLEEAQTLATELKNDKLLADVHNTQGDVAFYRGDTKAAKEQYQQALPLAQRGKGAGNHPSRRS